jgi:hypothetical protein
MLSPAEAHYSALWLQCRCSEVFGVDMHPGARLGKVSKRSEERKREIILRKGERKRESDLPRDNWRRASFLFERAL